MFNLLQAAETHSSTEKPAGDKDKKSPFEVGVYRDATDPEKIVTYRHFSDDFNSLAVVSANGALTIEYVTLGDTLQILVTIPGKDFGKLYAFKDGNIFMAGGLKKDEIEYAGTLFLEHTAYRNVIKANPKKFKVVD